MGRPLAPVARCLMKKIVSLGVVVGLVVSCASDKPEQKKDGDEAKAAPAPLDTSKVPRLAFNRTAIEHAAPVFWVADDNSNNALDPNELAVFWAPGSSKDQWVKDGAFTDAFRALYEKLSTTPSAPVGDEAEVARRAAVLAELAQGRPTVIRTVLTNAKDKAIVQHIEKAATLIERIHAKQNGVFGLDAQIPADDTASRAMFHRNQGPFCEAPKTEKDPNCHALASKPKKVSGLYPASIQSVPKWCEILEKRKDADAILSQFTVVQHKPAGTNAADPAIDDFVAVPYHEAYKEEMTGVHNELLAAAKVIGDDLDEAAFKGYLQAAAKAFTDGSWFEADRAWKAMTAKNSKWYLRIGPDEVYFEPCSRKAGFHVSFARINQESLAWQEKLDPVKAEMEQAMAKLSNGAYKARDVGFDLPDFIDIVLNAGDARSAHGATIGQSLPNWGPVADSGGRTVAMTNLYTDPDSTTAFMEQAGSLLCVDTFKKLDPAPRHGTLSTVLHEAAHNLGPSHEYKVKGKTDDQVFGGPLASMLEELKAQTAALYFSEWLVDKNLLPKDDADKAHIRDVTWAFGHIAQGMFTGDGKPKPYSQLAAIQMGYFFEHGVLTWNKDAQAPNGSDVGCMEVNLGKWRAQTDAMAKVVVGIKARGDKATAEKTRDAYVKEGTTWAGVGDIMKERWLREGKLWPCSGMVSTECILPRTSLCFAVSKTKARS